MAHASAVQQRPAAATPLKPRENSTIASGPSVVKEVADSGDRFVPVFSMLPQNEYTLYARCRFVLFDMKKLPGIRHVTLLANLLPRRAPAPAQRPRTLAPLRTKPSFAPSLVVPARTQPIAIAQPPRVSTSPAPSPVLAPRAAAPRKATFAWPRWSSKFSPTTAVSAVARRARNLRGLNLNRSKLNRPKLNWSSLWHYAAPAAVVTVVLAFAVEMVHHRIHPAQIVQSQIVKSTAAPTVTPTSAKNVAPQPTLPKPTAGKIVPAAQIASVSRKPIAHMPAAVKTSGKKVRMGSREVQYFGDDVTVRTFSDQRSTRRSPQPNSRTTNIGSDVTVRYFPPARPVAR
jgi:hypothetical protein